MKRTRTATVVPLFAALLAFVAGNAFTIGATIYVPDNYPNIQAAIDAAVAGDTVVVRNGTWKLTAALDFKGKAITVRSENGASSCFLDGQQQTRIFYFHSGETNASVLSGFTIQNGRTQYGAGIYLDSSSPRIENCTISANAAYHSASSASAFAYGGGIFGHASSLRITKCTISGNHAEAYNSGAWTYSDAIGAGIYISGGSPLITDCTIDGNTAAAISNAYGAGIYTNGSSPSIINSTISNNNASGSSLAQGGGLCFSSSTPSLVNSIISGNSARHGAGIYFTSSSSFSNLTNCTIVRNTAVTNGGGLDCANTSPKIINSILWENSPQEIYTEGTSNPTITYSDVLGGYAGTGNINASPLFANIGQQNFHLTAKSPCLNVGSNDAPELPSHDKDGRLRIRNLVVDMGAYEYEASALTVFRPGEGLWYSLLSTIPGSFSRTQWGISTDVAVPGDYDGDFITDVAVWRPDSGTWYVLPSNAPGSFVFRQWGMSTDKPVPGDYDADGRTDYAVWRPESGFWHILASGSGGGYIGIQFGSPADIPTPADFDGDDKTDVAFWRPSTGFWYYIPSSSPATLVSVQWGVPTDIPVPGDYDGDGKTDIAVLRASAGLWFVLPSNSPGTYTRTQWGLANDIPVPLDYDSDGKVDITVWRPGNGTWYIQPSAAPNTYTDIQWGSASDLPVSPIMQIVRFFR